MSIAAQALGVGATLPGMYLVAIGWLYVVLMMSLTERSFVAGLMTFVFYGVFPLSIVLYLLGAPLRGKTRRQAQIAAPMPEPHDRAPQDPPNVPPAAG